MSGVFVVDGSKPLCGTVRVPAAKNSVLPIMAASLLCESEIKLCDVPRLADVECCGALLRSAGRAVSRQGNDVVISGSACRSALPAQAENMRASVLFLSPLLARLGHAEAPMPGGCRIGARPIDLHLAGLERMGARRLENCGHGLALTAPGGLRGADITLGFPSVGATETLIIAAACARGETILRGAAREPEIADLARFINMCGGSVLGAGGSVIRIAGRRVLGGCAFSPMPDRIFASTFACAAAAAGGSVGIQGCDVNTYAPVLDLLEQMGCNVSRGRAFARVERYGRLHGAGRIFTGVYPGLATDAAPLLAAVMLCADGESCIEDTVFENRFACAEGFAGMGARVRAEGRALRVLPAGRLRGADTAAPDLRGGAALVLAALAASGRSRISGLGYIERGYEALESNLASVGAQIRREEA